MTPFNLAANQAQTSVADIGAGITLGKSLRDENERLKALALSASLYSENVARLEQEIQDLRGLLALPSTPGMMSVAADIIAFLPDQNRLTLSRGSADGVRPGLAIVSPLGMLGVVQTVDKKTCQGVLLTSAAIKVGAMDASRNPPQVGLMQGYDGNRMSLVFFDPKSPVEVGDTIVTSGFGPHIPRGLVIGKVIQIQDNLEEGTRRALISPSATVGQTREVKILL